LLFRAGGRKGEGGGVGLPRGGALSRPRGRRHPCFLAAGARAGRPPWTPARDADPGRRPCPRPAGREMRRGSRGGRPPGPRAADPGAARSRGGGSTDLPEQGWRECRPARSGRPQFAAGVELQRRAASPLFCSKTPPGPATSPRRGRSSVRRHRSGGGAGIRRAGEDVAVTSSPPLLLAGRAAGEHKEAHAVASASGRRRGRCRSSSQGR
jgi:hypothetical protein